MHKGEILHQRYQCTCHNKNGLVASISIATPPVETYELVGNAANVNTDLLLLRTLTP